MLTIQTAEKFNKILERKIEAVRFDMEYSFIGLVVPIFKLGNMQMETNLTCIK